MNLGVLYLENGRVPEAILNLDEASRVLDMRLGPAHDESFNARVNLVYALLSTRDSAARRRAKEMLQKCMALNPSHPLIPQLRNLYKSS